ncbi:C-signal-like [Eudromia elegans]
MAGARSALLTGCDGGLGLALLRALLEQPGPPRLLFAACLDPGSKAVNELALDNPHVVVLHLDPTDAASIKAAAAAVSERLRGAGLNLLLTGAGPARHRGALAAETAETMLLSYAWHTAGPLQVCQAFLPLLLEAARAPGPAGCSRAAVVNLSSSLGSIAAAPGWERGQDVGYRCSQAALNMLTKCLALEYGGSGVVCVALAPGCVTPPTDGGTGPVSLEESARGIVRVLATLSAASNGTFLDWRGQSLPW